MEEKKLENNISKKPFPFFKLLFKNLFVIILISAMFGGIGYGYSRWKNTTTYTATVDLMFKVDASETNISNGDKVTLANTFLPMTTSIIKSPKEVENANNLYKENGGLESIKSEKISVSYGEDSLIFSITYVDSTRESATEKLNAVIENASNSLSNYFPSEEVSLLKVQNIPEIVKNENSAKYIFIGIAIGFILTFGIVLLRYALDNTIKDKAELEELTNTNVIAFIEDTKLHKK